MLAAGQAFCTMIGRKYDRLGRVTGHGQVELARIARPVAALHRPEETQPLSPSISSATAYARRVRALRLLRNAMVAPSQTMSSPTPLLDELHRMRTHSGMCSTPTLSGPSIPGQVSFNISFSRPSTLLRSWRPNLTSHEVVQIFFKVYSGYYSRLTSVTCIASP